MNHGELIHAIWSKSEGVTKEQVREVVTRFVDVITDNLSSGEPVRVANLGVLDAAWVDSLHVPTGIDGESHDLPRRRVPKFRFSRALRRAVALKEQPHGDG